MEEYGSLALRIEAPASRYVKAVLNERGGHAGNCDPLLTSALAGNDPNRPSWDAEPVGEERDERIVRGAFDRRRGDAHEQRVVTAAGDFGFSGSRSHSDREDYAGRCLDAVIDHGSS